MPIFSGFYTIWVKVAMLFGFGKSFFKDMKTTEEEVPNVTQE
jgi:hypothetical protein